MRVNMYELEGEKPWIIEPFKYNINFIDAFHLYIAFEKIQLNEHTVLICTGKDIKQRDLCQSALNMTEFNIKLCYIKYTLTNPIYKFDDREKRNINLEFPTTKSVITRV